MRKFIGDRKFYTYVMTLVIPMILQNLITTFVSMIDNIMVGQIGTAQMSGVSIVNQFIFIFNITMFGAMSGPSIFGAQFFGRKDYEGQKQAFRFRLISCAVIVVAFLAIFYVFKTELISIYLAKDEAPEAIAATLLYGQQYMNVALLTLLPYGLFQAYSSVIRECGETKIPMYASLTAVGLNVVLDYGLIFGKLGMPELGVVGAAWATVIAKIVEAAVVIYWAHSHTDKNLYIVGAFKNFKIPKALFIDILKKSVPLCLNEFLWVIAMSIIAQCYSIRGLDVVAARNIESTLSNLFIVVYVQLGASISIIVGPVLGRGELKKARDLSNKLLFFCIVIGLVLTVGILPLSHLFPQIYNTSDSVKELAAFMIIIQALGMPIYSFTNAAYFVIRSGGKTLITFLFDFIYTWFIMVALAVILSYFTGADIRIIYAVVTLAEVIKFIIGALMVKSDMWLNTLGE